MSAAVLPQVNLRMNPMTNPRALLIIRIHKTVKIPLEVLAVSPAQMEIPVPDRQTLPAMEQAIQTLPVAMTAQIQP